MNIFKCNECEHKLRDLEHRIQKLELTHTNEFWIVEKVIEKLQNYLPSNMHYIENVVEQIKKLQVRL